jgi:hypothetical protein
VLGGRRVAGVGLSVPRFIPVGAARRRPLEGGRCYAARSLARWPHAWLAHSIEVWYGRSVLEP